MPVSGWNPSSPGIHIRNSVSDDFETLVGIDRECFAPGISYDEWELGYFVSLPGAVTLVAETEGMTSAFLIADVRKRKRVATLVTLDVLRFRRRAGIGSALLGRSEELLRERDIVRYVLQVDTENTAALEFYQRHAFAVVDRLPEYYTNGADAYLMEKSL